MAFHFCCVNVSHMNESTSQVFRHELSFLRHPICHYGDRETRTFLPGKQVDENILQVDTSEPSLKSIHLAKQILILINILNPDKN